MFVVTSASSLIRPESSLNYLATYLPIVTLAATPSLINVCNQSATGIAINSPEVSFSFNDRLVYFSSP